MADYITKIRTQDGDLPYDYNSLANLPEVSSDSKWYKVVDFTSTEEVTELNIPLTSEAIECLNSKKKWTIEITMDVAGSTNDGTSLGTLNKVSFFRTWDIVLFSKIDGVIPTKGVSYASPSYIKLVYEKPITGYGVEVTYAHFGIKNWGNALARMESRYCSYSSLNTGDVLKLVGSVNIPAGTNVKVYATEEREVAEL